MRVRFIPMFLGIILVFSSLFTLFAVGKPVKWATPSDLGGEGRHLAVVSLDKPIYRPGETVYSRIILWEAVDHKPMKSGSQAYGNVEVKGPKGDIVAMGTVNGQDSVLGFSWVIPDGQAGGEYTLKVSFPSYGYPPSQRKFDIRSFRAPRLKSQIVFLRDGYGPGEKVTASLHSERAEGGFPEGAKVSVTARIDGDEVHSSQVKMDKEGNLSVSFELPKAIERGDGTLSFAIEDGGTVETAAKTIPILLQTLDLTMFPEGGDLVENVPCRVYLQARTPNQKPADLSGIIIDGQGKKVAEVRTEHEGRGRFVFTPKSGEKYSLKIVQPGSIKKEFPLPIAKAKGATIFSSQNFVVKTDLVKFKVSGSFDRKCFMTLCKREKELDRQELRLSVNEPVEVALKPGTGCGVLIATLWDEEGNPLAERLVYKEPTKKLKISVDTVKQKHVPGSDVRLRIKTTDDSDKPIGAMVGLTVTDESVLEMIETREQAPRLPVMVLLENDVQELADAHIYLDETDPGASLAVDLLLGTQGWRRFGLVDPVKFVATHGDPGRRALALMMVSPRELKSGFGLEGFALKPMALRGARADDNEMEVAQGAMPAAEPAAVVFEEAGEMNIPMPSQSSKMQVAMEQADREVAGQAFLKEEMNFKSQMQQNFVYIREYAHKARPNRKPGERTDFTETVFWNTGVKTDPKSGEAEVAFQLSDTVTTFKVMADGFAETGALGEGNCKVESLEPFSIEPKIPLEVSSGDLISLPIGVINNHSEKLSGVTIKSTAQSPLEPSEVKPLTVGAGERVRGILPIYVGSGSSIVELTLDANAGSFKDRVTKKISVKPRGFPIEIGSGGLISSKSPVSKTFSIPKTVIAGSLTTKAVVYPTPLANLTEALERMLCEPSGCFEQTSSTNYPLVMAQQYFLSHTGIPQDIITKAKSLLDKGYNRLIGFECKQKGYEWFGEDPGHEALSAYGLLEFTDMSQVRDVDAGMLQRTREWLFARRDGKGGFTRARRALHTWIEDRDCSNAYITWALLEASVKGLDEEISLCKTMAAKSNDSYVVALSANVLIKSGDVSGAKSLLTRLSKKQGKNGALEGAKNSIVGSCGEALAIEATSFAVLAWLSDPEFAGEVEKGMAFLAESCKGGRFSSTQATVLALRAIVNYDKARAHPKAPGSVQLLVDGSSVGTVKFDKDSKGSIVLPDFPKKLGPGEHKVELKMTDGSEMPFSLTVNYNSEQPANSSECKLALSASLKNSDLLEGAVTEAKISVQNKTNEVLPMPVAIIGIPGGLEPRHDQLKELVKRKEIDAYEVIGRDVVLYWRSLKADQVVKFDISLVAAVPGSYEGPASRSYQYYVDEHKTWTPGLKAKIKPRGA